jgi:hypothetical protein
MPRLRVARKVVAARTIGGVRKVYGPIIVVLARQSASKSIRRPGRHSRSRL